MKPVSQLFSVCLLTLLLTACAAHQPRPGMYWGNYEQSLYRLADSPSPRATEQHIRELRNIVQVSDARGWPPPPGVMLELAVMEVERGNEQAAALLVNREYHLYPESRAFIRRWFAGVLITPPPASATDGDADDANTENTREANSITHDPNATENSHAGEHR